MAFDANDLSPHEHFVVERTREGEIADFSSVPGPDGAKPVVRAGFLRKLLLRLDPSWPVQAPGVRIKGARIEGALDLSDCASLPALALTGCEIPSVIDVSHSRLTRLSVADSKLRLLEANQTTIDGEFSFDRISPIAGGDETLVLSLPSARIGGDVRGYGAHISEPGGRALFLQSACIGGSLLLGGNFRLDGCLWMLGVEIGGGLHLSSAQLTNRAGQEPTDAALAADGAHIGGNAHLNDGFKAEGALHFVGACVGGAFDLSGATMKNDGFIALNLANAEIRDRLHIAAKVLGAVFLPNAQVHGDANFQELEITPSSRRDANDEALGASAARIGGLVRFQGANIKGEIDLANARIDGALFFGGGRFLNGGGCAILATNLRVAGNISFQVEEGEIAPFGQKTLIEGGANFERARIDGALMWRNLEVRGKGPNNGGPTFSFADAIIAGPIEARGLTTQADAQIDASGASCAALDDDVKAGWGAEGARLSLEGFSYGSIDSAKENWRARLGWLKRTRDEDGRYSPQPFSQAAQAYARAGKRESARRILLAQHDLRAVSGAQGPITWLLSSLFGLTSGYGLAPIRVARALALYLALGVFGVLAMNAQGALVTPEGRQCNGAIEPALYAIDVALPLIDLGQQSACAPGRTARADLSPGMEVSAQSDWRLFEGLALWRWAHALYAILGAILAALAVLTFSGVMKPKDS